MGTFQLKEKTLAETHSSTIAGVWHGVDNPIQNNDFSRNQKKKNTF
jgi:hypothetical protein